MEQRMGLSTVIEAAAFSETGAVRSENQDAVYINKTEKAGLFVVADGMGGHYKGGFASSCTVGAMKNWWEQVRDSILSIPFMDVVNSLENAIRALNRQIYQAYLREGKQGGTTLCVLLLYGSFYAVFHVGDSRIYCYSQKKFRQLSVDDVWENKPYIKKLADSVDLRSDSRYGRLTNAIGAWEQVSVSVATGVMKKTAVFFLCSDGVYKYCEESRISTLLKRSEKSGSAAGQLERLKAVVYGNGAGDNLSAVLVVVRLRK